MLYRIRERTRHSPTPNRGPNRTTLDAIRASSAGFNEASRCLPFRRSIARTRGNGKALIIAGRIAASTQERIIMAVGARIAISMYDIDFTLCNRLRGRHLDLVGCTSDVIVQNTPRGFIYDLNPESVDTTSERLASISDRHDEEIISRSINLACPTDLGVGSGNY